MKLSTADWASIVVAYQRGDKTIRQLAEQFGCTHQAISKGLRDRGIEKDSRLDETRSDIEDAASEARKARVNQANTMQENYARYFDTLAKIAVRKVLEAEKIKALPTVNADMVTLKNAIAVVSKARQESWETLNIAEILTDEDELPELNIGEYSPDEIASLQEQNERDFVEGLEGDEEDEDRVDLDEDED